MKKRGIIFVLLIFSLVSLVKAEVNLTEDQGASLCIESSISIMQELEKEGFSILRVNDTIKEAKIIFQAQEALKSRGSRTDYSKVFEKCVEIENIRYMAFSMRDQINALNNFYKNYAKEINSSEIDNLFSQIQKEMKNERYEYVPDLIEKTYNEISKEQARIALMKTFYDATTKGMKRFLRERWKEISISLVVLFGLIIYFYKPLRKYFIKRKIFYLEVRKKSLKDMIAKNQEVYFNKGKISETEFTIKNKKLAELLRDIDRQIPLLKEQLGEVNKKKK